MIVKFKKLQDSAVIPKYAKEGDAAFDLVSTEYLNDEWGNEVYKTGLAMEIPTGYVGLLFTRSSVTKYDLQLANSVGVIDSGYRGEIIVKFKKTKTETENVYKVGDRVAQLVILELPKVEIQEVEELGESERGQGGFGSTGK